MFGVTLHSIASIGVWEQTKTKERDFARAKLRREPMLQTLRKRLLRRLARSLKNLSEIAGKLRKTVFNLRSFLHN